MTKAGRPRGSFKHLHPARADGKATRAYTKWTGMIQRCYNPAAHNFAWYGGRGIAVCERWRGPQGYDNFILDMGAPPPGLTLDRVDNEQGYSPENCKWSTWKEQAQHRRQGGGPALNPLSLRQRALAAGLTYHAVYFRINRLGWTVEQALSTPLLGRGKPVGGWKRA